MGHLMLPALKEGATAFLTAFQCSLVWPVSRLVPPRNCNSPKSLFRNAHFLHINLLTSIQPRGMCLLKQPQGAPISSFHTLVWHHS